MKKLTRAGIALAITAAAVFGMSTPANAASNSASCPATSEICRVTLTVNTTGPVTVKTNFPGVTHEANWGVSGGGRVLCSGRMTANDKKYCFFSGHNGRVTFEWAKGGRGSGSVSISTGLN